MSGGGRHPKPIELHIIDGKKHFSKQEIEDRKAGEIHLGENAQYQYISHLQPLKESRAGLTHFLKKTDNSRPRPEPPVLHPHIPPLPNNEAGE